MVSHGDVMVDPCFWRTVAAAYTMWRCLVSSLASSILGQLFVGPVSTNVCSSRARVSSQTEISWAQRGRSVGIYHHAVVPELLGEV